MKAQVLVAGRGRAGGIVFAETPEDAELKASTLFGKRIKGHVVKKILVVEKVDIDRELYLGITIDRFSRGIVVLASTMGGVEIEELAKLYPEKVVKCCVNPLIGLQGYQMRHLVSSLKLPPEHGKAVAKILDKMYRVFIDYDGVLVESNPLAVTKDGRILAVDARMIIDDNSLYMHPEFAKRFLDEMSEIEKLAEKCGFSFVKLEGNIGIIGNGAGLTMATMDLIHAFGGKPANFLDIGGGASSERVREAVKVLLHSKNIKLIFINILGGITRCDEVARGIIEAVSLSGVKKPIVVRMIGTREAEGIEMLKEYGITVFSDMERAAKYAVKLAEVD